MLKEEIDYVLKNLSQYLFEFDISSILNMLDQVLGNMTFKYYEEEYDTDGMRLYIRADVVYREMLKKEYNDRIITDIKEFMEEYREFPVNEVIEFLEGKIKHFEENPHYYTDDYAGENLLHKIKLMSLKGKLPQNKDSKYIFTYTSKEPIKH